MDFIGKRRSAVSTLNPKPPIKYHDPLGETRTAEWGTCHSSARPGLCPKTSRATARVGAALAAAVMEASMALGGGSGLVRPSVARQGGCRPFT